jgi:hypothetical protein
MCPAVGNRSQYLGDGGDVLVSVATQSTPGCGVQIGGLDDNQTKAVGRDEIVASRVIDGSLLTAMDPTHGESFGLVEERVGAVVLKLSVLDDELMVGPVPVDGETSALSVAARVAEQPVKSVLTGASRADDLIAQA